MTNHRFPAIDRQAALALLEFTLEADLLALFCVHRTTLRRWKSGQASMPYSARLLAWVVYGGRCFPWTKDWIDWTFGEDGLIYGPYAQGYSAGEVSAGCWLFPSTNRENGVLYEQIARLTKERDYYRSLCKLESKIGLALMGIESLTPGDATEPCG